MVVANFGMGIRPSSSVVLTDQGRAEQQAATLRGYQSEADKLSRQMEANAATLAAKSLARTTALTGKEFTQAQRDNLLPFLGQAFMGSSLAVNGSRNGALFDTQVTLNDRFNELQKQISDAPADFAAKNAAFASSQQAQQAAYNANQGGPSGGVLGGVSQAGTRDPSQPTASMPWGQPWSTPGFGNPGSLGGLGGYKPSGQQGWGSVFGGGRNPWSLA